MKQGDEVWVARWALSKGILRTTVRNGFDSAGGFISVNEYGLLKPGVEVFATRDEAMAEAEKMRAARLDSLRRQIEKLAKRKIRVIVP